MDLPSLTVDFLVHLGYVLMLIALLARDVLWLRSLLLVAQGVLAMYAWHRDVLPIAFWNLVFVCINAYWVTRILRERREVQVPVALKAWYERHFAALSTQEFLSLWSWGERCRVHDEPLLREGASAQALHFLLEGEVAVRHGAQPVTRLGAGSFVGEMSLLTGEICSADVQAIGTVELMRWPRDKLEPLRDEQPALWVKIQSVLGHDLIEKIRRASGDRTAPA